MNIDTTIKPIKCHKCRHILLTDMANTYKSLCDDKCDSYSSKHFVYLLEDQLPSWIKKKIDEEQWTRGKLLCEKCGSKIGSFDFVSGRKCSCEKSILPSVYFVTSQIDIPICFPNLSNS